MLTARIQKCFLKFYVLCMQCTSVLAIEIVEQFTSGFLRKRMFWTEILHQLCKQSAFESVGSGKICLGFTSYMLIKQYWVQLCTVHFVHCTLCTIFTGPASGSVHINVLTLDVKMNLGHFG